MSRSAAAIPAHEMCAAASITDVADAYACPLPSPRDKAVLVAVAAAPNAWPEDLAALTAMDVSTVRQCLITLVRNELIYIARSGGYRLTTTGVIA